MASIHLETRVSANTLLNAIEQMSPRDLARLRKRVMVLSAQRRVSALSPKESRLLAKINRSFADQDQYDTLITKRLVANTVVARRDSHHSHSQSISPAGRAAVYALHLNRVELVNFRRVLFASGDHPPEMLEPYA